MSYIQDKLETFEQFLMEKCPCHTNNSPEGFEKWLENLDIDELMDYAMDYRNQSLTDYHNHIVDKINKELKSVIKKKEQITNDPFHPVRCQYLGQQDALRFVLSLLQDTNPKE